jgi:hypothetical protein
VAENDPAIPADDGAGLIGASPRSILAFAARTIAWCVPLFALWYAASQPLSLGTAWMAGKLLDAVVPVERTHVEWRDDRVIFVLAPDATTSYAQRLKPGVAFEVPVEPRKQTYGLPFFVALLLAARSRRIGMKAVIGSAVLVVLASIGVACEAAIGYAGMVLPGNAHIFVPGATLATLIALGFQLGTLIFPSVAPVALWAGLDALRRTG